MIDGFTGDQRFFFGFAQAFRSKERDAALLAQIKSDPHSPDEFRVNGVVRNHDPFYRTFAVKPGDALYLPPAAARLDLVAAGDNRRRARRPVLVPCPTSDPIHSRAALAERFGPGYRWRVLATVMIGTVAAIMASTIINVAVPDMSRAFALGQDRAQWLSAGFMGAMTLSMLTTPWLLERYGYRHTYTGTVALLMVGGIVGGLSPWFDLVLAMRVAEGLAAGVLQPIPAIVILHAFGSGERGRAMGIFGFGVVLAPAVGPSVGGILVEWFGWRSIFFVVTPFCVLALAMARRYLPVGAPGGAPVSRAGGRLDVVGLGLIAVAVLALLNGMVHLNAETLDLGLALMACCLIATIGFVVHQRRGARPLMTLGLFDYRAFSMGGTVAFIYGMGLFGSTYLVPVFMQEALHLPPSQAGAVLLPAGMVLGRHDPDRRADGGSGRRVSGWSAPA